jgi:poly(3-hydroxybutyrate) depolymerase
MPPISLQPGTPDNDNREYLPESLKGSDIVVNENGNNSQPYPARLQEHKSILVDGEEDTWYLYVPESYRADFPTPLVISMHGGLMTGWGQAVYTSWTMIAEREGFLVLFPNAHLRRLWLIDIPDARIEEATAVREDGFYLNRPPKTPDDNHDMRMVLALIDRLVASHNVDPERIYMQGMSLGDGMTDQFTRYFGDRLAGAAGSGGPTAPGLLTDEQGEKVNRGGPVPIWQTRLELDYVPPHYGVPVHEAVTGHREYWIAINGTNSTPSISIHGVDNLAFYEGGAAPVVFRDVKNRDHGQTLDDAELVWSYLFSGTRRLSDGRIEMTSSRRTRRGDATSIAIADGSTTAWLDQEVVDLGGTAFVWHKLKYHGLEGQAESRGAYLYAPVGFIARALHAQLVQTDGRARLTWPDGLVLEVARGSIAAIVNGDVAAMVAEAVDRDGQLYLPMEWVARDLRGLHASSCGEVLYITDHHAELSRNMALIIADLLS